ncbi:excalibur calcium-binding domain-containing protein [Micrococcus luteus]|nr:excalibur calcium-binding domain-containing protein [Micrococcus luteus]
MQALWTVPRQVGNDRSGFETRSYYQNCDAARAAGVAPIYEGEPGYRPGLDRDKDGIACDR